MIDKKDLWLGIFQDREEPALKVNVRKLKFKTTHYLLIDKVLYKCGHSFLYLRCLAREEIEYALREVHE